MLNTETIDWLMEGDPVIRWLTMRDILDCSANEWQLERERTIASGWGSQFLERLLPDGTWPEGRWTGTVWTLLTIMDCGLPPTHTPLREAATQFIKRVVTSPKLFDEDRIINTMELCHLGFWLRIGVYFKIDEPRLADIAKAILRMQMDDGGWNCRIRNHPKTRHGSFHTTFNVLEGLRPAVDTNMIERSVFDAAEARAMEFMLAHQMYRSDKTGNIIDEKFTYLTFPSHWHYTILRGLDYMRTTKAIVDARLDDPIAQLLSRRNPKGRWVVEKRIAGTPLFDMEKLGGESRWNTLRALRVLRARVAVV